MNECRLAYALAMQEKWWDFDEHFAICKPNEEQLRSRELNLSKLLAAVVELVEMALAEKKRRDNK